MGVFNITDMGKLKSYWAGCVTRIRDIRCARKLLEWKLKTDMRSRERSHTRWTDNIKEIAASWLQTVTNQHEWKHLEKTHVQRLT